MSKPLIFKCPVTFWAKAVVEVTVDGDNLQAVIVEGVKMDDQVSPMPTFQGGAMEDGKPGMEALQIPGYPNMLAAHALYVVLTAARDSIAKVLAQDSKPDTTVAPQPAPPTGQPN